MQIPGKYVSYATTVSFSFSVSFPINHSPVIFSFDAM
jgi:hypothetical protein